MTEPKPAVIEMVEQDTADGEDIGNIFDFILPTGVPDCQQLSVSFNKRLLDGWVKQPSPCCAAAAVAGAFNCLSDVKRGDPRALDHMDVLRVYVAMFEDMIRSKKESFQRKLGGSVEQLLELLFPELRALGFYLEVQKPKAIKRGNLRKLLLRMTHKHREDHPGSDAHPLECIYFLFGEETMAEYAASLQHAQEQGSSSGDSAAADAGTVEGAPEGDDEGEDAADEENDDEEEDGVVVTKKSKTAAVVGGGVAATGKFPAKLKKNVSKPWDWVGDLMGLLRTISGLRRLSFIDKPSTTAMGNWGLLRGVPLVSEYAGLGSLFSIKLLMGTKIVAKESNPSYITVSKKDTVDSANRQWEQLRSEFLRPNCVLLYHLKNHYALIFAIREWYCPNNTALPPASAAEGAPANPEPSREPSAPAVGVSGPESESNGSPRPLTMQHVRQVLTARRGQRPTVWVDFEEMRATLTGWDGYKVMCVHTTADSFEDKPVLEHMRGGKDNIARWHQEGEEYREVLRKCVPEAAAPVEAAAETAGTSEGAAAPVEQA